MLPSLRNLIRNIDQLVWYGIIGVAVLVGLALVLLKSDTGTDPGVIELTLNAASTQSNVFVPTLASELSQTPQDSALTSAAPTLALAGRREVRAFAASAQVSSERDTLAQGAVQATGPTNTEECGDYRSAWASAYPNELASLTLLYAELVTPTGIIIYETYNPGFISRVEFMDTYGGVHVVYEQNPQLATRCPFTLVIPIQGADYEGNRLTIYVDQTNSAGGWTEIDAVELIGIKH